MTKEEIKIGYFFIYCNKSYVRKDKKYFCKINLDDTFELIDSNRKWRTGSFVKMGFYNYVIVGKKGVQVDLSQFHDFDKITIENISMVFDKKGKCVWKNENIPNEKR